MENKKCDLAIAYRIYPKISKEPPIFKDDKKKLSDFCLRSFKQSLGNLNVKIWALLDNCPEDYEHLFKKYFNSEDLNIIHLAGIGNKATFNLQIKILQEQNHADLVYFAEDDYFYFKDALPEMVHFLRNNDDVDFVTCYDHPDYYTNGLHENCHLLKVSDHLHWRTANSTCCTFLTTKRNLIKTSKVLRMYAKLSDQAMWLCLTKKNVFKILYILKSYFTNRWSFIFYLRIWKYGWRQIMFGVKWKLWAPIPSLGTHMNADYLPPTIEWNRIFDQESKTLI
jgi:hypothetical protein